MTTEHVDVLIVGAGLSGIGAAYHLQTHCPGKRYLILEGRDAIGGTWDLFRYPGVRSDSDMYTLGYAFRPWPEARAIADGPAILNYIRETAAEYGIERQIRFGHRVVRASWCSSAARWNVEVEVGAQQEALHFTCTFLYLCTGYYDYASGYTPAWPGLERFTGMIVHPQHWPTDLDYVNKNILLIGSGATAVTLLPALARQAAHVTMLQRSPTYIVSMPVQDSDESWLRRHLPRLAYNLARWRAIIFGMLLYNLARRLPALTRKLLVGLVRRELGPDYDVDTHFTPHYNPWDQRLCLAPDADFFAAIRAGKASVVTGQIHSFSETGVQLRSGQQLTADLIVTATGLQLKLLSGIQLVVDGTAVDLSKTLSYKGMMYSDVPNLASAFGYTNASWTLKCELTSQYVCRLLNYMDRHGYSSCVARRNDPSVQAEPALNFTSGYVQRVIDSLPRQGSKPPWKLYQNYLLDLLSLRFGRLKDRAMQFRSGNQRSST